MGSASNALDQQGHLPLEALVLELRFQFSDAIGIQQDHPAHWAAQKFKNLLLIYPAIGSKSAHLSSCILSEEQLGNFRS